MPGVDPLTIVKGAATFQKLGMSMSFLSVQTSHGPTTAVKGVKARGMGTGQRCKWVSGSWVTASDPLTNDYEITAK